MASILVPLHIKPSDDSDKALQQRYNLHAFMSNINPNGWPKPHKSGKCVGRAARLGDKVLESI